MPEPPTAVVNLPKRRQTDSAKPKEFLVSDTLFIEAEPTVTKEDITDLFNDFNPTDVQMDRNSWIIHFSTKEEADCAYTLINYTHLKSGSSFRLGMSPSGGTKEPEPAADVFCVKNLPDTAVIDRFSLFHLFRPFGPMHFCKFDKHRNAVLLQFFKKGDADVAQRVTTYNIPQVEISTMSASEVAEMDSSFRTGPKSMVDYTNLYIKNLDHSVKSSDLFNSFRKFGRIISARVMKNPQTKQSKGFGFVSFSKADEAYAALKEMNGCYIMSKPIIVAFHEPKKPRSDKGDRPDASLPMPVTPSLSPAQPTFTDPYSHCFQQPDFPTKSGIPSPPWQAPYHVPGFYGDLQSNQVYHDTTNLAVGHIPPSSMAGYSSSPNSMTYGAYLQPPPFSESKSRGTYQPHEYSQSAYHLDDSNTSGTSATYVQRERLRSAILQQGESENVDDIVDMIATLRRRDLSLCLFNPEFLRIKINQAKNALQSSQGDNSPQFAAATTTHISNSSSIAFYPAQTPKLVDSRSKGTSSTASSCESKQHVSMEINTIMELLNSLPTLQKKKEELGERLYPCVRATGVKRAPAITIWLLDHMPLDHLVRSMYNESSIKAKIKQAITELPAPRIR